MDISVIFVSYNTSHLLRDVMTHLMASTRGLSVEVIFVDNASKDDSVHVIKTAFPECRLIENTKNVGFGRANNQALSFARGRYVLLLNTDAFVRPDTLLKTMAFMDSNLKCGILGVRLEGRDGVLQPCARYFPTPWNTFLLRSGLNRIFTGVQMVDNMAWDHSVTTKCDWVVGCFYLVRREVIAQVGLFDPRYFLYYEEVDHCFAAKRAGWDVVFYPHTTVIHLGGESAKSDGEVTKSGQQLQVLQIESELLYFRKNFGFSAGLIAVVAAIVVDVFAAIKAILRRRDSSEIRHAWTHAKLVVMLWLRTGMGAHATR